MPAGWIIKRNNKENGPFSPQQLKQFASSGKLKPEDLIRKEPGGKFVKANSVKGLFPEESLEEADPSDSAVIANIDISRYADLPMEDEDEDDEDDGGSRKKSRSKSGGKSAARSGGKGKKPASKRDKAKARKEDFIWENDPVNDLAYGIILLGFAIGFLFFMDPATYELPDFMDTIHEYTGRFGVSAAVLLISLIFWIPAFLKMGRLKSKGYSIPWHFPTFRINLNSLFGGSEESEE
jgi:hypothetical protein